MTARSERRDREMAVIDAAVKWKAGIANKWRDAAYGDIAQELSDAVVAYCEYGLAEPARPRAGLRSPETSHDAAEWAKQFSMTDAGMVFRLIYYAYRGLPNWEKYDSTGLTVDEIEVITARTHQSMSARVNALKDAGWIVDSTIRRKTRSGSNAIVWTPSVAALGFVNDTGMPIPVSPHPRPLIEVLAPEEENR